MQSKGPPTMKTTQRTILIFVAAFLLASSAGADWPGFRGPKGLGLSDAKDLSITWGPDDNVLWKTKLPGPGTSSPVVWGDRVFLTCFSGYGLKKGGDIKDLRRHVLCLDRKTGKILWDRPYAPKLPESEFNGYLNEHGYASSTPATDGERLYVFFGRTGVVALDLEGMPLWHVEVGKGLNGWGSASSPVLYKGLVIVNASVESSAVVALERETGKEVWRTKGIADCWSTPLLVDVPGGKVELVLNTADALVGIDPNDGERLWRCEGLETATASSTPVARAGVVYVSGAGFGNKRAVMAVRAGGRGEVTQTHVIWKQEKVGGNHTSPVLYDDFLYCVGGTVSCVRADTGQVVYQERLYDARQEYPSPVAADGKIILPTRRNGTYVLAAGAKYGLLAHNDLGDATDFNASPAVSDGQLFLRSNAYAYCIGKR
jgi:outer membrane protein assembly factor BamB